MEVAIQRIGFANRDLLRSVAGDVFDEAIDFERVDAYLADPNNLLVVAVVDGTVVAQCMAVLHRHPDLPSDLYVDNLGTDPSVQRNGIATRLVEEVLAWGRELGAATAWVATEVDNAPARAFYGSLGGRQATMAYFEFSLTDPAGTDD